MATVRVQSKDANYGQSTSSRTVAFNSDVTAGSLLVVFVTSFIANVATTFSVTDSLGQTYTQAGSNSLSSDNNSSCSIWYFKNTSGGPCTITVSPGGNNVYITLIAAEYSGLGTAPTLNATHANSGTSATPSTGTCTASAGDLVVAGFAEGSAVFTRATATVASPFTLISINALSGSESWGTADDVNAAGNEGATWTLDASVIYAALAASFTPSGAAPDYTPFRRPMPPPEPTPAPVVPRLLLSAALLTGGVQTGGDWMPSLRAMPPAAAAPSPPPPRLLLSPALLSGGVSPGGGDWLPNRSVLKTPALDASRIAQDRRLLPPSLLPGYNPVVPGRGKQLPLLPRVPELPKPKAGASEQEKSTQLNDYVRRLARHTEILHSFWNYLVYRGVIVQTGAASWELRPGCRVETRPPNNNDDASAAVVTGMDWIDSTTQTAYKCFSNAQGAAVWRELKT